jgi:hypothetical protein
VSVEGVTKSSIVVKSFVVANLFFPCYLNFFLRILVGSRFPSPSSFIVAPSIKGEPEPRSEPYRRDGSNRRTQRFKLVVGVNLGFRRRMAREFLPDFLGNASIRHCAVKRVPQAVIAKVR